MTRPVLFPDRICVMRPELCGSIGSYIAAWACGDCRMDWEVKFDKRMKSAHRFAIADTRGMLRLTVPVAKPHNSSAKWSEIAVSPHDSWWDIHRVTLESAYGRTPYYEFYADRFMPMLTPGVDGRYPLLADLARAWHTEILDILGMHPGQPSGQFLSDIPLTIPSDAVLTSYRQVRQSSLGFIAGLSVLDLIFNLGPDAQIYLNNEAQRLLKK